MKTEIMNENLNVLINKFDVLYKILGNSNAITLPENELIEQLKCYSILNDNNNEDIIEYLRKLQILNTFSNTFNKEEINYNNKWRLKILGLLCYRLIQIQNNKSEIEFKSYIKSLTNEEINELYINSKNALIVPQPLPASTFNISDIIKEMVIGQANHHLIDELTLYYQTNKPETLLYPSSGCDYSIIDYFKTIGNSIFSENNVFIFVDFDSINYNLFFNDPLYTITTFEFRTNFRENSTLKIVKLSNSYRTDWIISFDNTKNEELLKELLRKEITIENIFCKVDGITNGMGGITGVFSIPTPLYLCFSHILKTKRITTQFGTPFFNHVENSWLENTLDSFKLWLTENLTPEQVNSICEKIKDRSFLEILNDLSHEIQMTDEKYQSHMLNHQDFPMEFYCVTLK
jgi:hypothetical protein